MLKFMVNFALPGLCVRRKLPNGHPVLQRPSDLMVLFQRRLGDKFYQGRRFRGPMELVLDTEPGIHNDLNAVLISIEDNLPAHAIFDALADRDDFQYPMNHLVLSSSMVESDFEVAKDISSSFFSYCRLVFTGDRSPPPLTELTRSCILPFSVDVEELFDSIRDAARKYSHIEEVECRQVDASKLSVHWSGYTGVQIVEVKLKCPRTILPESSLVNIFHSLLADSHGKMKLHTVHPFSLHVLGYERKKRI